MDIGTVLSVAQNLFAALQSQELVDICSVLRCDSELDELTSTVATVRSLFIDAKAKPELKNEAQHWIQRMKDAVFDADDLFDEFLTLIEQKQLMDGGKAFKQVILLFSCFIKQELAYRLPRGVNKIRKRLKAISSNPSRFMDYQPIRSKREETSSCVLPQVIIGRDADTRNIVDILLDHNVQRDVSFLSIVGMAGLGKTTLAQLVYNHPRVINEFPLRLWVCLSDEDETKLDMKGILGKILESATGYKHDSASIGRLQTLLREQLEGKKYLIVLDDVCSEKRDEWLKLAECLTQGRRGSWIIVTTRSRVTARDIGNGLVYELPGLSEQDSWTLFTRLAFGSRKELAKYSDLVEIGREIVKRCSHNPLAIRMVGGLLYGQAKNKWLSLKESGLAKISQAENCLFPILNVSYHYLTLPLKSCFSYCALFPKNFEIEKEMLISLWMAQGYIVPNEEQSIEDAGEEYFSILLQRCFLHDVREDEFGDIISCKLHDLMHDVAREVAGKEICAATSITRGFDKKNSAPIC